MTRFNTENEEPSPWWHHLIMQPIYILIMVGGSELILRRNPQIGIIVCFSTFITVPLYSQIIKEVYTEESGLKLDVTFSWIKAYSLAIPVFLDGISKISNAFAKFDNNNIENTDLMERKELHLKKINKCPTTYMVNKCCMNWFNTDKKRKRLANFFCILFAINIIEAILFEAFLAPDKSYFSYSNYINALAGTLILLVIPSPFDKRIPFWEININGVYNDLLLHARYGFIILYSTWNVAFCLRYFDRHVTFYHGMYTLSLPILRTFLKNDYENKRPFPSIWLQTRVECLFLYITLVVPIKNALVKSSMNIDYYTIDDYWYNLVNLILAIFNVSFALFYVLYYYIYLLPKILPVYYRPININVDTNSEAETNALI